MAKKYVSSRSYNMDVIINGEDLADDLTLVRITSSLSGHWPIITLVLNIPTDEVIRLKLYGGTSILFTIKLIEEAPDVVPKEVHMFELMLIDSEFEMGVADQLIGNQQRDRTEIILKTIPVLSHKILTSLVNDIYGVINPPKTPKEVIETLVSKFVPDAKLKYDTEEENTEKIPQILVPPTTLIDAIKYINRRFGLYNGAASIWCDHLGNLNIMNLSKKIKKARIIQTELLNLQSTEEDVQKTAGSDTDFHTLDNIESTYVGNARFSEHGTFLNHVVLPSDTLSHTINQSLKSVCSDYGLIDGSNDMFVNDGANNRLKYYISEVGQEKTEFFANAKAASNIFDLSRTKFQIDRNIRIKNFLKPGEPFSFKTKTVEHVDITKKYILFASDLVLEKSGQWEPRARIELVRTNKII